MVLEGGFALPGHPEETAPDSIQYQLQVFKGKGLAHERERTAQQGILYGIRISVAGHYHDIGGWVSLSELAKGLGPAHLRHDYIKKDHAERSLLALFQRLSA